MVYKSKKQTKDGRSWFFRIKYRDIYGKDIDYTSPKFNLKREAQEAETKYRITIGQHNSLIEKTFDDLFLEYIDNQKQGLKEVSIKRLNIYYNIHLKSIIGHLTVSKLNINLYESIKKELVNKGLSVRYANKILGIINRLIKYSQKYYGTYSNVPEICGLIKEPLKVKKEMQFFTYDEFQKFISVIQDDLWRSFFILLYYVGLRQGEAQALNWHDIDFEKRTININKTLTTELEGKKWFISSPKTKNSIRILPLPKRVLKWLKTLQKDYRKYKGYSDDWFVFGGIRPLPRTTIQNNKNKYCKLANVKQIRIHDFRHSCASLLINQGANITLVSKWLGHSNISITLNTYTHLYESELDKMANIIDKL